MVDRGLPHGRGYRRGPNATVTQNEEWSSRRREVPKSDGWIVSAEDSPGVWQFNRALSSTFVNNLNLVYLRMLVSDVSVTKASVRVATAGAGEFLHVGLYIYKKNRGNIERQLILAPESKATFDLASTGTKVASVSYTVLANERYFIGSVVTGSTARVTSIRVLDTTAPVMYTPVSGLPDTVTIKSLSKSVGAINIPTAEYYSAEAVEVYDL